MPRHIFQRRRSDRKHRHGCHDLVRAAVNVRADDAFHHRRCCAGALSQRSVQLVNGVHHCSQCSACIRIDSRFIVLRARKAGRQCGRKTDRRRCQKTNPSDFCSSTHKKHPFPVIIFREGCFYTMIQNQSISSESKDARSRSACSADNPGTHLTTVRQPLLMGMR